MSLDDVERRLSAILSADVVGYSRLLAEDEDGTIRRLTAYREEIDLLLRQSGGRLVDFTGDNFLAEFPSALEATRCALEIQRVISARNTDLPPQDKMEFRIGVHLGDVRVEQGRLFGTGVNIAARLEGLAEPGGLCLSGTVHEQLEGKLRLDAEDLGEQSLKNIIKPVRAFRVRSGGSRARDDGTPSASAVSIDSAQDALSIHYARRIDGAMTAYGVMGSGPVLIMPPGAMTHLEWYTGDTQAHRLFCRRLASQHTLVLYDRHGCGLSDRHRKDYSAEDDLLDLDAVTEAIGEASFDFFGISWGGVPAVAYAAHHAERVRRMVLYGTYAPGAQGPGTKVETKLAALAALQRADAELYSKTQASRFFPSGTDRETFQSLARMLRESTTPEVAERLREVRFDNQSVLAEVRTPALVLHRRGDQVCPFEWGQFLARRLPNARFVPLDGDAHFPWVDDSESVLTPVLGFLAAS